MGVANNNCRHCCAPDDLKCKYSYLLPTCASENNLECACPSFFQSEDCCAAEDSADNSACRCPYLQEACRKSLEQDKNHFCTNAVTECCGEDDPDCECGMYEDMCTDHPSEQTCDLASTKCCPDLIDDKETDGYYYGITREEHNDYSCKCNFFEYAKDKLDIEINEQYCSKADAREAELILSAESPAQVKDLLKEFYSESGGDSWFDNTG